MSSSSTTACSRSPSPSPATPESTDGLDTVLHPKDLSAWCNSLPPNYFVGDETRLSDSGKPDVSQILALEDLLQDAAFQDPSSPTSHSHLALDPRILSKLALPQSAEDFIRSHGPVVMTKPVPPPPSQPRPDPGITSQRVVFPPKETCYNLPIIIPSIPEGGTKSRVETQVRLAVDLAHASASSGEPLKYDRVGSWKWLRLPRGTSTKKRTRKEGKVDAPTEDTLFLTAEVTCATAPHTRVTCCSSCQTREAKRVARKIAARVRPARSDTESQDEIPIIPGRGKHEDTSNIVQFNCPEVLDFSAGSVVLPLRITCYCRHHREKTGFNVHFRMLDNVGRIVGSGTTRPIMITDDHKTTGASAQKAGHSVQNGEGSQSGEWNAPGNGEAGDSGKRKKARTEAGAERAKKRTKPYDVAQRITRRAGSTEAPSSVPSAAVTRSPSPLQGITHNPLSPLSTTERETEVSSPQDATNFLSAFDFSSPIMDALSPNTFDPDIAMDQSFDSEMLASLQELTDSMSTSPAASIPLTLDPTQSLGIPPAPAPFMLFDQNPPPPISGMPAPKIHRLIPAAGPTYGGIEVTVLGANFLPSMNLNCVFGGIPSSSTQRWSDNTLVCMLPPSTTPGVVTVWFEGVQKDEDGTPPCLFTYHDETDKALMELALQVVGLKMTGKIEDARNVAMRIVGNTDTGDSSNNNSSNPNAMQLASDLPAHLRHLMLSRAGSNSDLERILLDFLSVLDVPLDVPAVSLSSAISHRTTSGQTLLHLAVMAKFATLVRFLISHDIDVDVRDRNGCTALHLAVIVRSVECARALIEGGAALDIVDAIGKTPGEIAPNGFFDLMSTDSDTSVRHSDEDDEAAWGDIEDESASETELPNVAKRRPARRSTLRRRRSAHLLRDTEPKTSQRSSPRAAADPKKALKDEIANEKQVASFVETLSRTLAQWQHPQGMIPNMPNLPIPHLPNLPGIPAWNALPQMPAVFPVFVPIPALSALWGERNEKNTRVEEKKSAEEEKLVNAQPWLAMPTTQDWRTFLDRMTQAANPARQPDIVDAPPAYSPRDNEDIGFIPDAKEEVAASSSSVRADDSTVEKTVSRSADYESRSLPEQGVDVVYRPTHKPRKQKKQDDRMLKYFWIPILTIGIVWATFHFMRWAFHTAKAGVIIIKAGLRV